MIVGVKTAVAPTLLILALPGLAYAQVPDWMSKFEAAQAAKAMERGEIPRGSKVDVNKGLPSSSRTYTGEGRDGFDLGKPSGKSSVVYGNKGRASKASSSSRSSGTITVPTASSTSTPTATPTPSGRGASGGILYFAVRGKAGPVYVDEEAGHSEKQPRPALEAPEIYVVRKGDTLWELSGQYLQSPWAWPTVWSYNPQVINPHWIYPGDQLRFKAPNAGVSPVHLQRGPKAFKPSERPAQRSQVLPHTVFSRDQGYLGDSKRDVFGELVGAAEDQMLLAEGNHVYLTLRPGVTVQPGQTLTVFMPLREADGVPGARKPPGEIVSVKGAIKVDQFNPKTRVARASIVEALDAIERGAKVGPVGRTFDVVAPKPATKDVAPRVLSSFYPRQLHAQHQLVFLDRGAEDGLEPGTRLFVLAQGDIWRHSLKVGTGMLKDRIPLETNKVQVENTPTNGNDEQFPTEVIAELRVVRTEKYSAVALVTESRRELSAGDVASSFTGR